KKRYYDQCWLVFDKDDFPSNEFNRAITMAQRSGFKVAYSNQAFEYWFLLHFNLYSGPLHRDNYAPMLTKLCGMPYSKREGFGTVIYNRIFQLQHVAIRNAKAVYKDISHGNPAMEESSTTVHLLVEELNKYH
ncbi:MAG: RloB family protein, partial [Prevotella sp.]